MTTHDILYENENYYVTVTDKALGEDGKYGRMGYAVINKDTLVTEHTTTVLPQALFQCDAFAGALGQMGEDAVDISTIVEAPSDDILPN